MTKNELRLIKDNLQWIGLGCLALWLYLPRAKWWFRWNLNDGTGHVANAAQFHAVCQTQVGRDASVIYPAIASGCSSANQTYTICALLFWGGLIILAVWAFNRYQRWSSPPPPQSPVPAPTTTMV